MELGGSEGKEEEEEVKVVVTFNTPVGEATKDCNLLLLQIRFEPQMRVGIEVRI